MNLGISGAVERSVYDSGPIDHGGRHQHPLEMTVDNDGRIWVPRGFWEKMCSAAQAWPPHSAGFYFPKDGPDKQATRIDTGNFREHIKAIDDV